MVSGPAIGISPVVSVIVPLTEKLMVSAPGALLALVTAARNEPAPLSLRFETVNVAGVSRRSSAWHQRRVDRRFDFWFKPRARQADIGKSSQNPANQGSCRQLCRPCIGKNARRVTTVLGNQ